jgi:hypothetical protein
MTSRDPKIIRKFRLGLNRHTSCWGCLFLCFGLWASAQAQVPAPLGLAQIGPYSGQVNLIWTPSAAATAYQISRGLWDMTNTPTPSVVATVISPTSGYTDNQVTDGRSYQYLVSGIDDSGNISNLAAAVTAIPYTVSSAVSPTVSNVHNNSLDLSWNLPLSTFPVSFYYIYRQSSGGSGAVSTAMSAVSFFASNPVPIATVTLMTYSDINPSTTNANFYCVVAVDNQGNTGSLPSTSTSGALPINSLPPVAPSLFGFIPVAGYGTKIPGTPTATPTYGVDLVWNGPGASEGVTNYQIYSNQTQIATIIVSPTPSPTYSYIDTPIPVLSAGAPIAYSIVALNSNGAVTSNTVSESIVAPSLSGVIQVTPNATSNSVTVTWGQGVTGTYGMITNYAVYRGLSGVPVPFATPVPSMTPAPTNTPTPFMVIVETPSRTPTLVAVDTIVNANGYTYWVQPVDAGMGGYIAVAATPVLKLAPTPVSAVSVSQVANTNNKINVTWSGAAPGFYGNITNYAIYRFLASTPTPTGTLTPIVTVGPTRSSRNDYVDDFSGTSASYSVGAVDSLGNVSDLTVLSNSVTLNATPSVPQMPHVIHSDQSISSLTYNWLLNPTPDTVTSYSIYDSSYYSVLAANMTPTPIATILPTPATVNSYAVPVPPLWQYTPYYLQANNTLGSSGPATLAAIAVPTYNVTAVAQPTQGVNVFWNMAPLPGATPAIDSFVVYRTSASTSPVTFYQPIATVSSSTSTYLDASVTPGTKYAYMVTARSDLSGTPVAESPISVTGIAYPVVLTWPNVPTGVSANTGSNATTLSWLPNPTNDGVQSYTLYRNGTATTTITPSPTMDVVFAETPGNISSYQVVANNSGGSMGSSSITVLAVPSMTPTIALTPDSFTASNPVANVWISGLTYPVSVGGYSIYNSTDPTFAAMPTPVSTVTSLTPVVSVPGQTGFVNYYKVVANNGSGVNANFTLSGLMGINLWPNPPSSFIAYAGSTAVTLTWSKPASGNSPVTAYAIYKGTASGSENPTPTVVLSLGSSIDPQITPGITYYYNMESISGGLYSIPATMTVNFVPATYEQQVVPGQAPILNGVALNSQVILTWSPVTVTASSPITEYLVQKIAVPTPGAVINSAPTTTLNSMPLTTTTYTDTAVNFNYGYIYSVVPVGFTSAGATIYGPYSNSVTLTTPPQAPASVVAVSGDQTVQLRWNYAGSAAASIYAYSIQRKLGTAPVVAYQTIASGLTGLDYTDSGLLDKTFYNYEILVSSAGSTGISQPVTALPAKPPVVDNPVLTKNQTQSGNTISWTAANSNPGDFTPATMYPLGGYSVYRSSDGGGTYQLVSIFGPGVTSCLDPVSILNGTSYTYTVYAFDAPPNVNTNDSNMIHQSPYSTILAPSLSASTALDRNSLRPFGAPNEQVVDIRFVVTNPGNVQIKVYSLSGTFIKQLVNQYFGIGIFGGPGDPFPIKWDGTNTNGNLVASGVYLITTEMNGLQEIDKIAVIK